jgi:hypothetical protein
MVGACLMFGYFPIWISTESKRSRECRGLGVVRTSEKKKIWISAQYTLSSLARPQARPSPRSTRAALCSAPRLTVRAYLQSVYTVSRLSSCPAKSANRNPESGVDCIVPCSVYTPYSSELVYRTLLTAGCGVPPVRPVPGRNSYNQNPITNEKM